MPKKEYKKRSDLQKLRSQWHKLSGLHTRAEWSAAVVRAASAAEIAANFAIRREFKLQSELSPAFADSMLMWANGIAGKLDRLLDPLWSDEKTKNKHLKSLRASAKVFNGKRNAVVHSGEFCNEAEAEVAIKAASEFIVELIKIYEPQFKLKNYRKA
jgi:hypothetical protein